MKRELIPYYVSRALFAALFGWYFGSQLGIWYGVCGGLLIFAGFLWYAHGGRYLVDTRNPLFPLRRDARGVTVRDRALLAAVVTGLVVYLGLALIRTLAAITVSLSWLPLLAGVVMYFIATSWYFARS